MYRIKTQIEDFLLTLNVKSVFVNNREDTKSVLCHTILIVLNDKKWANRMK